MSEPTNFFQVGGTLSENASSYIERPADKELFAALQRGELCLVLAPRQMGKSSLMVRTISRLRKEEICAGYVDLQRLGSQRDPNRWFGAVVNQITRSLKIEEKSIEWWQAYNQLDAVQRFVNFLEDVVLKEVQENVVIFFDEIDSALALPFSDDFFTTIRSIYNERAMNPTLKRLTFVLLGVATVSSLIRDRSRTSFNIGRAIALDDFDKAAVEPFREVLGRKSDALIKQIFYWTNGQPYLVQKLAATAHSWEPEERRSERIDDEVNRTYLQNRIEQGQDNHLKFIQDYLLAEYEVSVREKLKVYREVLAVKRIPYNEQSLVQNNLRLSGIVRVKEGKLLLRNRIYEKVFDLQWVQKHAALTDEELFLLSDARRPAFVPNNAYDIFVCYTHVDDIPEPGVTEGWVTTLIGGLKVRLARSLGREDAYKLWIDTKLAKLVHLTPENMKTLRHTATFIVILSRAYLASDWCRQQKNRFLSMIQERLRSGLQVFVVEIDRLDDNERPREFGNAPTYRFWVADRKGKSVHVLGMPQPTPEDPDYYKLLDELSYDVVSELERLKKQAMRSSERVSSGLGNTPYPGLRPFNREEADVFFGREVQTEQLVEKFSYSRFISVVGLSGCGKTSLVQAGLLASLERGDLASTGSNWRVLEMSPGNNPLCRLAELILSDDDLGRRETQEDLEDVLTHLRLGFQGLVELFRDVSFPEHTNFLLFIDQFEEIFRCYRQGSQNEVKAFVDLLLASVKQSTVPIYVVITMRSEFVGDCAMFHGFPEMMDTGQFLTPCLTPEQQEKIITRPASVFGGDVEPRLVKRLLEKMETRPDQLPLLQHCLRRMWLHAKSRANRTGDFLPFEDITMTLEDYEAVGELKNALSNHAEEVFEKLDEKQQDITERMFRHLSDRRADHRYMSVPVSVNEVALIAKVSEPEVIDVADAFRQPDCSIITPTADVPLKSGSILNISYDSLFRQWCRLSRWVKQETKSAETYNHLEQTARSWKQEKAALWGTPDLENVLVWREQEKPTQEWAKRYGDDFALAMEFLDASARKRKRKWQFIFILISLGLILIVSLVTWGFWESSINEQLRQHLNVTQILIRDTDGFLQNEIYYLECGETVTISVGNYWLNSKFDIDYKAAIGEVASDGEYKAPDTSGMDVIILTVSDKETQERIVHKSIIIEVVDSMK